MLKMGEMRRSVITTSTYLLTEKEGGREEKAEVSGGEHLPGCLPLYLFVTAGIFVYKISQLYNEQRGVVMPVSDGMSSGR